MLDQIATPAASVWKSTLKATSISTITTCRRYRSGAGRSVKNRSWRQTGICRFGFVLPMDECLARCARISLVDRTWNIKPSLPTSAWRSQHRDDRALLPFALLHHGRTLHLKTKGKNDHHRVESLFKPLVAPCARPSAWKATPCPRERSAVMNVVILDTGCANLNS